jgi:hypothetical protein
MDEEDTTPAAWGERLASAWQGKRLSGSLHSASVFFGSFVVGRDDNG